MTELLTAGTLKDFLTHIPNETTIILEVEHLRQSAVAVTWAELMGRGKVIMFTSNENLLYRNLHHSRAHTQSL